MKLKKNLFRRKKSRLFKVLSKQFEKRNEELLAEFREKHKETSEWLEEKGLDLPTVLRKGSRGALAAAAVGTILLSGGLNQEATLKSPTPLTQTVKGNKIFENIIGKELLDQKLELSLKGELPLKGNLSETQAEEVSTIVSKSTGVSVKSELDGNKLNTNFGLIGLEQHLPRYPGETLSEHFGSQAGSLVYGKSGMTSARGSFGYFAKDRYSLSTEGVEQEKYYVVVQTFLISGWGKKPGLADWLKHRKVLVVNPENGKAVVGDIADSGPAVSTGKSFGGSPELMDNLGLYHSQTKGAVLMFFIDETQGSPNLGPL